MNNVEKLDKLAKQPVDNGQTVPSQNREETETGHGDVPRITK